jgi:hypothetical protein
MVTCGGSGIGAALVAMKAVGGGSMINEDIAAMVLFLAADGAHTGHNRCEAPTRAQPCRCARAFPKKSRNAGAWRHLAKVRHGYYRKGERAQ